MAKELCIHVEKRDIYTGAALSDLSRDYSEECAFPLGRTFTLLLESYADEGSNEVVGSDESKESVDVDDVYQANVSAFVLWIKQMAPMVNKMEVKLGNSFSSDNSCDRHFTDLVSRLYQLGNRVRYSCINRRDVPVELGLDKVRDLVHINFRDEYDSGQFSHLARRNAQTLQSFYLQSPRFKDLANLIQNPDGSYATYPCLQTMKLCEYTIHGISRRPVFPGAVPFPILQRVGLRLQYPFGDDVLFRGNSATLESLVLQADSFVVSMIRQYGVFTPTSHPKLQCVIFRHLARLIPDTFATYAEGVQYALSIGPGAVVRKIGVPSSNELLPALLLPGDYSSIRVLSITRTDLDIWQAISLIKALPLLSDLHAPLPRIGTMPDGVTRAELPAYMVSTYSPLGERFRCWHLERYRDGVECMLLLALICPNFDYVAVDQQQRESLMDDLEWYIDLDRFKPYAPRLRRLLFNGWQSC